MSDMDRMLQHADDLQFGVLEWTRGKPFADSQACLGFVGAEDQIPCRIFSTSVCQALDAEALSRGCSVDFLYWNDHECHSVDEAADFLRAAAKRLA